MAVKRCATCKLPKPVTSYATPTTKRCNGCVRKLRKEGLAATCKHCGEHPGWLLGRTWLPRAYCTKPECQHARREEAGAISRPPPPAMRKTCPNCLGQFPRTEEYWYAAKRDPKTGEMLKQGGLCKPCHRAIGRDHYNSDPEYAERRRQASRRRYARVRKGQ